MRLYGAIGPRVDGDYFAQELASLDRGDFDMIHIRMNSPGGNVFQGMSIVSAILPSAYISTASRRRWPPLSPWLRTACA